MFKRAFSTTLGALLLTAAALAATAPGPGTVAETHLRTVSCVGACTSPTNAGKVFRWGDASWRREFIGRRTSRVEGHWHTNHPALLEQREGMLTLHAHASTHRMSVEATDQSARYGRWEARVRVAQETRGHTPFTVMWDLTPTAPNDCHNKIVLAQYRASDRRAHGAVRTAPDHAFRYSRAVNALGKGGWHTYAVEVTPTHISWFVDTKVIRTERRDAALSGTRFRPQFAMLASRGHRMNRSRMQMDWVRYYDLHRPNARSIKAPRMALGTAHPSC